MKICIVLGTRPEIIKMSPVIRACKRQNVDYFILHTGQHYSYNMDRVFFEQLELPEAKYNLDVGSCSHGDLTKRMLEVNDAPNNHTAISSIFSFNLAVRRLAFVNGNCSFESKFGER